jgi:anthranilate phosphoribosyltransferase
MSISHYIKEIGRGTKGARSLTREQACDLMGQLLDGKVSDLELGGFCIAMRFKGESAEELAGFLDATQQRLPAWPVPAQPVVVIPSYNGARKLANLTPLLAALLAQQGLPVLVHGCDTENKRLGTEAVWQQLGWQISDHPTALQASDKVWMRTRHLLAPLERLLQIRRQMGLRNPAHSWSSCWTLSMAQRRSLRSGAGQLYPPGLRHTHGPDTGPARRQRPAAARHRGEAVRRRTASRAAWV